MKRTWPSLDGSVTCVVCGRTVPQVHPRQRTTCLSTECKVVERRRRDREYFLRKNGPPKGPARKILLELHPSICVQYKQGSRVVELAETYAVHEKTIRNILNANGVDLAEVAAERMSKMHTGSGNPAYKGSQGRICPTCGETFTVPYPSWQRKYCCQRCIPKPHTDWSRTEEEIARLLRAELNPSPWGWDCRTDDLIIECKEKSQMPKWLTDSSSRSKIVVLHEKGQRYDHSLVVIRLDDFRQHVRGAGDESPDA